MLKPILFAAFAANVFFVVSSSDSCNGDPNAQPGCDKDCVKRCPNQGKTKCSCPEENSCECKDGYVFDTISFKCVLPKDCQVVIIPPDESSCDDDIQVRCNANEIYVKCPLTVCGPKCCSEVGYPIPCVDLPPDGKCPVDPACICKDGYVWNEDRVCIPIKQCPSCGGDPNAVSGCGNCNKSCRNYNQTISCTAICYGNACDCRKGYVVNELTKKCVLPGQCPKHVNKCTKPNEVYDICPAPCPPRRCDVDDRVIDCAAPPKPGSPECEPGCRCRDGYYRNYEGICVTRDQCPRCSGPNQVFDPCPPTCPPQKCGIDPATVSCLPSPLPGDPECVPGCRCIDGYVKDTNSICIPRNQCPPKCGKNEAYSDCINSVCLPQNCSQAGFPVACVKSKKCTPGCLCNDGYLRNKKGFCIPKDKCPSCGGDPNSHPGCGVNCGRRCSNYNKGPVVCPAICNLNGCDCDEGFVFDDNIGKCVLPKDCTPTCGKDEVFSDCVNGVCQPQNCSQAGFPVPCEKPKKCTAGCICKDGYLRNKRGVCIPKDKCPSCGGDPNSHPGCGENCGRHCSNYNKGPIFCSAICHLNGCDCDEGYVYDDNLRKCVLPMDCTPTCNKPNEEYVPKLYDWSPRTCDSLNQKYVWDVPEDEEPKVVKGGCQCKSGYYRNVNGDCVTEADCRKCPGPHEYFACGVACDNVCATLKEQNQTNCPIINIKCNEMCYCQKGYARDENKICIPIKDCNSRQCGVNERYETSPATLCVPQKCSELGYDLECPNPNVPNKPACVCVFGYVRNDKGVCIPKENCPSCAGDPNKRAGCGIYCNTRCSDIGKESQMCILMCYPNGCECIKGYYLDEKTGLCVPPEKCSTICGNNEVYSECINGGCQPKNCSQLGKPIPCVKIDPKYCIKGCLCKEGYLRADNGICVPEKECKPQCRKPHQVYNKCPPSCPPNTCESVNVIYECPEQSRNNCKPDCVCEKGYYKNKIGECITKEECQQCQGPHEYFSCGGACDNVCATLSKMNQTNCPIQNIVCNKMCYCEKDYARALNGTCIPISKCNEPQCPVYEQYEECPDALCIPQTCAQSGKPMKGCPSRYPKCPGKPGCICIDGFLRNDQGVCIPKTECPQPLVCGNNEVVSDCINGGCDRRNCSQLSQPQICIDPIRCIRGCICREGYLRDNNGVCVPIDKCPRVCGKHEVYNGCIQSDCRPKNCSQLGYPIQCPRIDPRYCIGGCVCEDGYVRDARGRCISSKKCPSCGGDPNAESGCGGNCNRHCSNIGKPPGGCAAVCDMNGCDCKDGYYYDDNIRKCVLPEYCTPVCGKNEVYSECVEDECRPQSCDQLGFPIKCSDSKWCTNGCLCADGYVRNRKGICIPKEQCPSCGGDPNAVSGCGVNCNKRCSDIGNPPGACILVCYENACDCRDDFFLDDLTGKCVPPNKCSNLIW